MSLEEKRVQSPREMPKTEKKCQFPDCEEKFMGIGAAKYCETHRKPEFRKIINEMRAKEKSQDTNFPERSNLIIKHGNTTSVDHTLKCPCGKNFEIILSPGVEIYPKYCEEHRNPYQRDQMLKRIGEFVHIDDPIHNEPIDDIEESDMDELKKEFGYDIYTDTVEDIL